MIRPLGIVVLSVGIVVSIGALIVVFGSGIYGRILTPDHAFGSKPYPKPPDYNLRAHWAAWPDDTSLAERLPDGYESVPQKQRLASAFFLHPTTYGGRDHWVQPMDDMDTIRSTDRGTISLQASVFNGCCRIYAPRYRQSNIMGYQEEGVAEQIFSIGYEDIRNAFRHFLEEIGPNEPFILASHSQGTFHLIRLIEEEVDDTPLLGRMIAAYAIGHALPKAVVNESYKHIDLCETPDQTNCFISWDAHESDKNPSVWSNEEEEFLWNGSSYAGFSPGPRICVNPITWIDGHQLNLPEQHIGALMPWSEDVNVDEGLGPLIAGTVSARCGTNDERNWLFVNSDRDERIRYDGLWGYFARNLHGEDYQLFWGNIRENAVVRARAWHAERKNFQKPNVVLILADDVGFCDTELYGCKRVPTPNLKELADNGVLFTSGYVTSPVCSPSRASLLTGRYQQRFGHEFLPEADLEGNGGLPVDQETLAGVMRDAGYATGIVGKWHLGELPEYHPINRGFDSFYGILSSASDYADPTREDVRFWTHPMAPKIDVTRKWEGRGARSVIRGTNRIDERQYLTEAFTREAVAFIEENKERPFFLYLPYTAVHGPLQITNKYYDRFEGVGDESKRIYRAMTSALDDGIGDVNRALVENGIDKNTLIIFLSDNGAGVADYTNNAPLRLGKHTLFEGGIRVPFFMKWPARISGGHVYDYPVSSLDVFPTVLSSGGVVFDSKGDGVDLIPFVTKIVSAAPHETLFWRQGPNWAVRQGNWKLIHAANRDWLYNLSDDIGETSNLASKYPDIVMKLRDQFDKWDIHNMEPLWPPFGAKNLPEFTIDGVQIDWML